MSRRCAMAWRSMSGRSAGGARKVGKALRQLVAGLPAPQSHQSRQAFPGGALRVLRARQVKRGIRVETVFSRTREPAPVSGLLHPPREFGARVRRAQHLAHVAHGLLRSDRGNPGLARLGSETQHFDSNTLLRPREPALLNLKRERGGHERKHVEGERLFDFVVVTQLGTKHREVRIRQPPSLHQVGFGYAQFGECRAQVAIVQNGHLYRIVGRQRPLAEQCRYSRFERLTFGVGSWPDRVLADSLPYLLFD